MKNSLGQRIKIQQGWETESERKKRVSQEKKEMQKSILYFQKIKSPKEIKIEPSITTDQLKHLFNQEAKNFYNNLNREFIVDDTNRNFYNLICHYFAEDVLFETKYNGELQKGLMIFGDVGTGKSSSLEIIQNISRKYNIKKLWFVITSTHNVVTEYNESKNRDGVIRYYSKGKIMFDDLGAEREASNYGKEDIFSRILEFRYEEFKHRGIKTFITTNYTLQDVKKRYGVRVYDRFKEMFNFIELDGESRRF